jgi:hypothetical protein
VKNESKVGEERFLYIFCVTSLHRSMTARRKSYAASCNGGHRERNLQNCLVIIFSYTALPDPYPLLFLSMSLAH